MDEGLIGFGTQAAINDRLNVVQTIMRMKKIGIGIIGCGGITLQNHLPGLALCPEAQVVALCDNDPAVLQRASQQSGIEATSTDYRELLKRDDINAVIIATPNVVHAPIALAAIAAGKHVLCEKPIAMNTTEAMQMYQAAEQAGVRHMTAFTYRFVPAMRYSGAPGQDGRPWPALPFSFLPIAGLGKAATRLAAGCQARGHWRTR